MRLYDFSQLPVLENGHVVGIVDEWDDKPRPGRQPATFALPVEGYETRHVETWISTPERLRWRFDRGHVVVVTDNDRFIGLMPASDVLTTGVTDWNNKERT